MSESSTSVAAEPQVVSARSARRMAGVFNYGNIIAMLPGLVVAPYIFLAQPTGIETVLLFVSMIVPPILWFGVSMVVYALARHHPNPHVGHFTQQAAYRFYALFGLIIPVGTFFGTDWRLWIMTGGIVAAILIPWSLLDLRRIARLEWQDTLLNEEHHV